MAHFLLFAASRGKSTPVFVALSVRARMFMRFIPNAQTAGKLVVPVSMTSVPDPPN